MNNRLQQFLAAENISQSQFADSIGVARASITHIISGRNKPGFDFIERMARRYPSLNIEWLVTGNGRMYKDIASQIPDSQEDIELFPSTKEEPSPVDIQEVNELRAVSESQNRKIARITVFFEDGTFQDFR